MNDTEYRVLIKNEMPKPQIIFTEPKSGKSAF